MLKYVDLDFIKFEITKKNLAEGIGLSIQIHLFQNKLLICYIIPLSILPGAMDTHC